MTDRSTDGDGVSPGAARDASHDGVTDAEEAPSVAARDELAGIVELFGALERSELADALSELAFKRRASVDDEAVDAAITAAVSGYVLVPVPDDAIRAVEPNAEVASGRDDGAGRDDSTGDGSGDDADDGLLAVGPAAFPTPPPNVEDLTHILEVPDRPVDRSRLADATLDRLRRDVSAAVGDGDEDRLEVLLEVTYDVETWAAVDAADVRDRILQALDG